MAYGIQVTNEFGDVVTDLTNDFAFYYVEEGNCVLPQLSQADYALVYSTNSNTSYFAGLYRNSGPASHYIRGGVPNSHYTRNQFIEFLNDVQWACAAYTQVDPGYPREGTWDNQGALRTWSRNLHVSGTTMKVRYPAPSASASDISFVQLPPFGICSLVTVNMPFPETGIDSSVAICVPSQNHDNSPLAFKIASTTPRNVSPETFGLQITNDNGDVSLDTRYTVARIRDYISITAAQVQNVIENNVDLTITLRTPCPNAFVACTNWVSARFNLDTPSNSYIRYANIRQTNDTTLVISREQATDTGGTFWGSVQRGLTSRYLDHTLLIAAE